MYCYAIACIVFRLKPSGLFDYRLASYVQTAVNEEEARVLVEYKWKKEFPESDGWNRYDYTICMIGRVTPGEC